MSKVDNYIREFNSPAEAVEEALRPSATPGADSSRDSSIDYWAGGTIEQAAELARTGYDKGAARLKAVGVMARIRQASRPGPIWDVAGSDVDMGRWMSGEPEHMVDVVRKRRASPVVKIRVERAVSHMISTEEIEATGAAVLTAVEALRTAGVPSEVWVTCTVLSFKGRDLGGGPLYARTSIRVQEAGMAIDAKVLAYWLVHPSVLRRINFAIWEKADKNTREAFGFNIGGGYGGPSKGEDGDFDEIAPAGKQDVVQWVRDVIMRRAGVEIREEDEL